MEEQQLKEIVLKELNTLIQNSAFREVVLKITQNHYANKIETDSRFDRMMDELVKNRQLLEKKIQEDNKKWEENNRRLDENTKRLDESIKRWDERWKENREQWEANNRRWEENNKRWEENNRRWDENDKRWDENQKAIQRLERKFDQTLGALGTRWGLHSESTFRKALSGILEDFSQVEVINVNEYDDEGIVFGHPDQIELDLIIKNGMLTICEIKSSMSKSDMYIFDKKVRFYEQKHNRTTSRKIVISPMLDQSAKLVAEKLNIEIYSYAEDLDLTNMNN